jgi:transcriptional regulator with XRE-family HTH domain
MDLEEGMAVNRRRLRHAKGMKQQELAERAGLSARCVGGSTARRSLAPIWSR